MKRLVLGLGLVGSLTTFATTNNIQANAKLETKYMKFNNDNTQEYKDMYGIGLKGNIKYGDWIIQVGDTYQKWKLADWINQSTGGEDYFSANVPYIRINRLLGNKILGVGFIYISGNNNKLVSDGAWGLNINFAGRLYSSNNLKTIGEVFWQYTAIRNGELKADITQFTPNILFVYNNIEVNPYITLQNINVRNEYVDTIRFSGGVKFKARVNSMFGLSGNVKYGRTVYFSDGENMDIMARYNRFKANIGLDIKPMQHLTITPKVYYEGYETFDKNTGDTKIQKGWGIGLNISYNF